MFKFIFKFTYSQVHSVWYMFQESWQIHTVLRPPSQCWYGLVSTVKNILSRVALVQHLESTDLFLFSCPCISVLFRMSYKWTHTLYSLLSFPSLTQRNEFESINSFYFYCWVVFSYMDITQLVYLLTSWRTVDSFQLGSIMNEGYKYSRAGFRMNVIT